MLNVALTASATLTIFGQSNVDNNSLRQRLDSQFVLTKVTADRNDIVTAGTVVGLLKFGLVMYSTAAPAPALNSYKNGKISQSFMQDMKGTLLTPGKGTINDYPHRQFRAAERLWVTGLDIQKDGIVFTLYSDPYDTIRYYAQLKFPYDKNTAFASDQVFANIAEVIQTVDAAQMERVAGMYVMAGAPQNQLQLNADGTFSLAQGRNFTGLFLVQGGNLMLQMGSGGVTGTLRGDTLTDNVGSKWLKQSTTQAPTQEPAPAGETPLPPIPPPPPPPDEAASLPRTVLIGQSRYQVIAVFGDPQKIAKAGTKEILIYADVKVTLQDGKVVSIQPAGREEPLAAASSLPPGVESGPITASNKVIKQLDERIYIDVKLAKVKKNIPQKFGDIQLVLEVADPKTNTFSIVIIADEKKVEKKNRTVNEPIQFLLTKSARPYELVINEIHRDLIVGYLSIPKAQQHLSSSISLSPPANRNITSAGSDSVRGFSPVVEITPVSNDHPRPRGRLIPMRPSTTAIGRDGLPLTNRSQIKYQRIALSQLVMTAYGIQNYELTAPGWLDTVAFDIVTEVPVGAKQAELQLMLRSLLAERFRLAFHREPKTIPVYSLVVGTDGPKFKESQPGAKPEGGRTRSSSRAIQHFGAQTMESLAFFLSVELGRLPVRNSTGLTGKYDFDLSWEPEPWGPGVQVDTRSDLFAAIQDQLGLKLEEANGTVQALVVDEIKKVPEERR
jgi:uncharacterized protein (TIGR03435 family)